MARMSTQTIYRCPECEAAGEDRTFTTPQALGRHRSAIHGVVGNAESTVRARENRARRTGSSRARRTQASNDATTTRRRTRSTTRKRGSTTAGTRTSRRRRTVPAFNRDRALTLVAPNGTKVSYELMDELIKWADEGARLHAEVAKRA